MPNSKRIAALVWLRDLDGTGSMHACAKGDPGAVAYVPEAHLASSTDVEGWRVKPLEWVDDHSEIKTAQYRFFYAETPLGRFAYGTNLEGICWWHGAKNRSIQFARSEEVAKRLAEETWQRDALSEAGKFLILPESPSPGKEGPMTTEEALALPDAGGDDEMFWEPNTQTGSWEGDKAQRGSDD